MKVSRWCLNLILSITVANQSIFVYAEGNLPPRRPPPGERPPPQEPPPGQKPPPLPPQQPPPQRPPPPPQQPPPQPPPPPQQPPGPPAEDLNRAREQGMRDGDVDGSHEGRTAGLGDGLRDGQANGRRDGYARCEREEMDREHDRGLRDGYTEGERRGNREGTDQGATEGRRRGDSEGQTDGIQRADQDARSAATGPGRQRGYEQANQSDAAAVGRREGIAAADRDARDQAEKVDYSRGRETLRREKWAEPIARQDEFSQRPRIVAPIAPDFSQLIQSAAKKGVQALAFKSEAKSIQPLARKSLPTPEEQRAYDQAYNSNYRSSYDRERNASYQGAYNDAYRSATENGCREARNRDYRQYYSQGYEEGQRDGYRRAYDSSYRQSFNNAYDSAFRSSSQRAYSANYDEYYKRHFETARAEAYKEQYDQVYQSAYRPAYQQKYDQAYPIYAEQAYQRGRADELRDFNERPLRLISSEASETNNNGLFEPGETLRARWVVRNFASQRFEGQNVKIVLTAADTKAVIVSEPSSLLRQALEGKSQTTVREALEFYLSENGVNQNQRLRLDIYVNGRLSDGISFTVRPQFLADLKISKNPEIKEGLPTVFQVVVKNQSQVMTESGLQVELTSQPDLVQVVDGVQTVGSLAPGQEKILSFTLIGRSHNTQVSLPLNLVATMGARKVGLINLNPQVPVANDYRVDVVGGLELLPQGGVARIEYQLTNVSSNRVLNGLQLVARFIDDKNENFVVVGPNPQYLAPLLVGQATSFVVPVLVKQSGSHGTIEIEVQENGVPVMIHRRGF